MAKKSLKFDTTGESVQNISTLSKKKFHPNDLISITPANDRQKQFLEAFYSQTPMILMDGPAGTGKSFLALYAAFSEVFQDGSPYRRVIVIRSAVEGRKIGFLPGSETEKAEPFEMPYKQIVQQIIKFKTAYNNLKALGYYEFHLSSHQRGTTYDNAIIIVDEVQNFDVSEVRTICTRVGTNSKLVLMGDLKQNDLARYREKSCFNYLKSVMRLMPYDSTCHVHFKLEDIVRSGFVRDFLIADSQVSDDE